MSKEGRLDLLVSEGLGRIAEKIGLRRNVAQPLIDRFVQENVTRHKMPVTPEQIAEEIGLLKKQPKPKPELSR